MAKSDRWGHRPRRAAAVRVPTNGLEERRPKREKRKKEKKVLDD